MFNPDQLILMMKGAISEMPPEDQASIKECVAKFEAIFAENPVHGKVAYALFSAMLAKKEGIN